ncbi:MAG TPA: hypothetical protein VM095_14220, partial [Pyrinomonadaceae bacterium]|nr:hypothetical protein [Pyrinomonadaceae bacterium]
MSNAVATDRKAIMRDKRAQGIAAMGLVTREGDRFRVATPTLRGRTSKYEVWRDEAGRVRCSCLEFEEQANDDATFRCEHILAVKHSLLAKNSEAVTKQQAETQVAVTGEPAAAPNTNTVDASEKRETRRAHKAEHSRSEREQDETEETEETVATVTPVSNLRSLAKHTNTEEQDMNKRQDKIAIAQVAENEEMALAAEPVAP